MSKRAVSISYELLKEFITKGYMIELVECLEGIPEDAICVDMFTDTFGVCVVMVFDSDNWDSEPSKYTRDSPVFGIVPWQYVELKKHYNQNGHTKVLEVGYDQSRFIIQSKTPINIKESKMNNSYSTILGNPIGHIDSPEWIEIEELT